MIDELHDPNKLANFRELGGIQLQNGRVVAGRIYRSDDLATIDADEAKKVFQQGIRLIIDLRSPEEATFSGRGHLADLDISYVNLPLMAKAAAPHQLLKEAGESEFTSAVMGIWYRNLLEEAAPLLREALELIAAAEHPVVFHCAAGKDRTGLLAACLLSILGASDKAIITDYSMTQEAMPRVLKRLSQTMTGLEILQLKEAGSMLRAESESFEIFFRLLNEKNKSIEGILRDSGLSDETVLTLRSKYSESTQ